MSILRDFFIGLPGACGVPAEIAVIEGERLGKLFDYEVATPGSVYARVPGQNIADRLAPAFAGWDHLAEPEELHHAKLLAVYVARSIDANRGKSPAVPSALKASVTATEAVAPKVSALMSVGQASTLGNWV